MFKISSPLPLTLFAVLSFTLLEFLTCTTAQAETLIISPVGRMYQYVQGAAGALAVVLSGLGAVVARILNRRRVAKWLFVIMCLCIGVRWLFEYLFGVNESNYYAGRPPTLTLTQFADV